MCDGDSLAGYVEERVLGLPVGLHGRLRGRLNCRKCGGLRGSLRVEIRR